MDMTPAVLIFTPIFLPIVKSIGIDPIQFGIIMVVNLCIGLCTPPVGSVLFVGIGVAKTSIEKVIKPLLPLFIAMILALGLITYFPQITLWLPGKIWISKLKYLNQRLIYKYFMMFDIWFNFGEKKSSRKKN